MKKKIKMWKLGWGLTSQNKKQKVIKYELSSVYSKVNLFKENRLIGQKYFYCDHGNEDIFEIMLIKTKEKIKIKKKEKEQLMNYLKEKNINIEYFEKFEGYINLVATEWFNEKLNIYTKNVYIYFYNLLLKIKNGRILIINIEIQQDIEIILILIKNYLNDFEKNILKKNFFNFSFFKKLSSKVFIINVKINYNCKELLEYFLNYNKLLTYYNTKLLLNEDDFKDFLYLQVRDNMEISKYEKFFDYDEKIFELFKKNKEFFNIFKGSVFLMEFDIANIEDKKKLRKYVLIFLSEPNWKWRVFYLSDISNINFVLILLQLPWIEDNYLFDEIQRNMIRNFVKTNTSLYKNDDEYFININNARTVIIRNKEELIYYIKYYKLFL